VKSALAARRLCGAAVALSSACAAAAQIGTEWRVGYMDCGRTQVRALAECYEATPNCISETLSFTRGERRVWVGLHPRYEARDIAKIPVQVLGYHAVTWTCAAASTGAHYVLVSLTRTNAGACAQCEYQMLYDLNGRLVASTALFNARGDARRDDEGRQTIAKLVSEDARARAVNVYR
jgi:hypothetical protein